MFYRSVFYLNICLDMYVYVFVKINISVETVATLLETSMFCSPKNILTTQSWKVSAIGGIIGEAFMQFNKMPYYM